MKAWFSTLAVLVLGASCAMAQDSMIWSNQVHGGIDSGWVVQTPTQSSDYFSVAFAVDHGPVGSNVEGGTVSDSLPIASLGINVADFGTTATYPTVGVYRPNVSLDPTGNTPNLAAPIATSSTVLTPGLPLFTYQSFAMSAQGAIPGSDAKTLGVLQLPPGDSGLLQVGADSTASGLGTSGFSMDGYATPAVTVTFLDLGLAIGQDNSATTSCTVADRLPHGRLRCQTLSAEGIMDGDRLTTTLFGGDTLNLAFFGARSGDKWRLYFATSPCSPAIAIGPLLPTIPDPDGDGSFLRINSTFPTGFDGQTIRFSAVWGSTTCATPGVGFTNCVTIITALSPSFGVLDDGTIESAWVVQTPSGSSDFFNNSFGPLPTGATVIRVGLQVAVLDFVTASPALPATGVSNPNLTVDPTGNTPDVVGAGLVATISPFTFVSGTFATTAAQYVEHTTQANGPLSGISIHAWLQFPVGDPALLTCGADNTFPVGRSYLSANGYTTPAVQFFIPTGNWGIRLITN